jgi:hypothetical protein
MLYARFNNASLLAHNLRLLPFVDIEAALIGCAGQPHVLCLCC